VLERHHVPCKGFFFEGADGALLDGHAAMPANCAEAGSNVVVVAPFEVVLAELAALIADGVLRRAYSAAETQASRFDDGHYRYCEDDCQPRDCHRLIGSHPHHPVCATTNMFMRSFAARHADDPRTLLLMAPGWVRTDLGGPQARLSIEESIPNLANTMDAQAGKAGLQYLNYLGQTVPW